jgi:hypothetical protein
LRRQYADAQKRAREAAASQKPGASRPEPAEGSGGVGSDDAHVAEDLIKKRGEYDKMRRQTAHLRTELDKLMGDLIAINKMKGVVGGAAVAAAAGGSRRSSQQVDADGGDDGDDGESGGGGGVGSVLSTGTPLQRRVRQLENRLDKTAVKHEEAVSIKRTYEQIVKRLRDERVSYDTQIAAMERAVASKSHDLEELKILANDSSRAIEQAQVELARVRAVAAADREKRHRELRERDGMARGRRLQAEMMIARDRARRDLLAEVAGDLGVSEERQLVRDVENARIERAKLSEQQTLVRRKLEAYEQAWRRIKDTTGVSEVVEVITKMAGQVEQHQHLGLASRENVHKIEVIKEEIEAFRRFLEELRYSNSTSFSSTSSTLTKSIEIEGSGALSSTSVNDSSSSSSSALSTLTDVMSGMSLADSQSLNVRVPGTTYEEVNSIMTNKLNKARDSVSEYSLLLMSARIGTAHLGELLSVVREAAGVKPLGDVTEENLVASMQSCQATLATIAERLRLYYEISGTDLLHPSGVEAEAASQAAAAAKEAQRTTSSSDSSSIVITPSPQQLAALGLNDTDLLNVRTFNTRVYAAKRAEVHEVEAIEAPVASEGDFLAESKGIAKSGDGGKVNELPTGTDLSVQNEVFFADEGHDAARNSIKKQAQRNADSHKRSSLARNKESSGGSGGGGFTSTATQEKNETKSGKQVRKIAGPPRHTY